MNKYARNLLGSALFCYVGMAGVGCDRQPAAVVPASLAVAQAAPDSKAITDAVQPAKDRAGAFIAEALRPSAKVATLPWQDYEGQRRLPAPRFLEQPGLPLPADPGELPRTPLLTSAQPIRPRPVEEAPPFADDCRRIVPPERTQLAAGSPVRVPGPDINQPVPVPILAQAVPDRAPLTDPSGAASLAAALAQPIPVRTAPVPFVRLNLPDPFAYWQQAGFTSPLEEDPNPSAGVVRTLTK